MRGKGSKMRVLQSAARDGGGEVVGIRLHAAYRRVSDLGVASGA